MEQEPPTGTDQPGTIQVDPRAKVSLPATFLIVVAGINALLSIVMLVLSLTGAGFQMLSGYAPEALIGGTSAILSAIVGLALAGLIAFGGLKMKNLESWPLALAGSIAAMIPCTSPCYILGIPVGIWAMMVIFAPEVKGAFRS